MAKLESSPSGTKTAARSDQKATGGSAGIEIVAFPQKLYTRTFGEPDTLFVPILEAACDANKLLARLIGLGEERGKCCHVERDAVGVFVGHPALLPASGCLYPYS